MSDEGELADEYDRGFDDGYKAGRAAARPDREGWQTMRTAPTDRFILLQCPEDGSTWLASWQGGRWYGIDNMGLTREGSSLGDEDVVTGWKITAWRDLPAHAAACEQ